MLDTVEKQQVLEASEFFADVPAFLRESILSSARLRSFACRDLMFVGDGPRNETILLMKGCAKIAQFTKDGKEIALRLAVPGELVSELGSRPVSLHSTTDLALFECEALAWPTETFDALLRFPILQRNVENILRRRIKEMEDRICRVTNQGAEHRVASELVRLSKLMGQKVNNHVEIMIPQETLGQMTAMNLFTVNRTLRGLENQGLVKIRSEEHTSELQSPCNLVCRLLLEKKNHNKAGDQATAHFRVDDLGPFCANDEITCRHDARATGNSSALDSRNCHQTCLTERQQRLG